MSKAWMFAALLLAGGCGAGDPVCVASCSAKECGSDGCGGSCGGCGAGRICDAESRCATESSAVWQPSNAKPLHFHWQLAGTFSFPADVVAGETVYDVDGDLNGAETVAQLHALGPDVKVVCYMEVGSAENYRSDYQAFSDAGVLGQVVDGWPDERWIDIRQTDKVLPLIERRMREWCAAKGFDAVEPDTSEVWNNGSGFPITQAQNDDYNVRIAAMAHALGLSVGLKNNPESATTLAPYYDWALVEQCWEYQECGGFQQGFLAAGKAVWNVEYDVSPDCAQADAWHMVSMKRDLGLVGPRAAGYLYEPCLGDAQDEW